MHLALITVTALTLGFAHGAPTGNERFQGQFRLEKNFNGQPQLMAMPQFDGQVRAFAAVPMNQMFFPQFAAPAMSPPFMPVQQAFIPVPGRVISQEREDGYVQPAPAYPPANPAYPQPSPAYPAPAPSPAYPQPAPVSSYPQPAPVPSNPEPAPVPSYPQPAPVPSYPQPAPIPAPVPSYPAPGPAYPEPAPQPEPLPTPGPQPDPIDGGGIGSVLPGMDPVDAPPSPFPFRFGQKRVFETKTSFDTQERDVEPVVFPTKGIVRAEVKTAVRVPLDPIKSLPPRKIA